MGIMNVRIDERLVHGIVATYWLPSLKADRVICIDEESAASPMMKSALRMATPSHIYLSVIPLEKAIHNFKTGKYGNEKIMVIAKTPKPLRDLYEAGIVFPSITMGNLGIIRKEEGSVPVTKYLNVTAEHKELFEQFHRDGVELVNQLIPDDAPADFYTLMSSKF